MVTYPREGGNGRSRTQGCRESQPEAQSFRGQWFIANDVEHSQFPEHHSKGTVLP